MHKMLLLLAVIATLPLIAQSPKEPWTLTLEERIALRTNPELARERVRRDSGRRVQTFSTPSSERSPTVDAFDGKTHPELFLPHQVFDELVNLAFLGTPQMGQGVRKGRMPEVKRHGLPPDFWERLQSVSAIFIADSWAERDIGQGLHKLSGRARKRVEEALTLRQTDVCRSRADALAAARNEFGRERFDRFLYEVVAVHMFSVADRLPDPELFRQAAEGCR